MTNRLIPLLIVLAATALSLVIIADTRLVARADLPTDDGLFLRLAASIRAGDWLGDYDQVTLSKGPGYPILIAVADALSIPLKLAEQSLYLLAAGLMSWVVSRLARRPIVGACLFAALALDPIWFLDGHARVLRETVYATASMLVVAGTSWLFLVRPQTQSPIRARDVAAWVLLGATTGFYWLVREEGIWLAPTVAFLAVVSLLRGVLPRGTGDAARDSTASLSAGWRERAGALVPTVLGVLVAFVSVAVVVGSVVALNSVNYGVSLTNDLHDGAFPRAVGALRRIDAGPRMRYVPVSTEARQAAYDVSPSFASLRTPLEASVRFWGEAGCRASEVSVFLSDGRAELDCEEINYGFLPWAFRLAALRTGNWRSATEAQAFLDRIAAEVNGACDDGRLACSVPSDSLRPEIGARDVLEAIGLIPDGLRIIIDSPEGHGVSYSIGEDEELVEISRQTHSTIAPPRSLTDEGLDAIRINGWVASRRGSPFVYVAPGTQRNVVAELSSDVDESVLEAADLPPLVDAAPAQSIRFTLETTCLADDCLLSIDHGDGSLSLAPVNVLEPGRLDLQDDVRLGIVDVSPTDNPAERALRAVAAPRDQATVDVQRQIDSTYATLLPWLAMLGLIGVVLSIVKAAVRRRYSLLVLLALACGIAVLSRVGMFALLEVSAWPGALRMAYLAPASPFVLTFSVIGGYLLIEVAAQLIVERRAPSAAIT